MPLTDLQAKNAKPKAKPYGITDANGLRLWVHHNGSKYWQVRYTFEKRQNVISFGTYPDVTLSQARERALEVRKQVKAGINPIAQRKAEKEEARRQQERTFRVVAEDWFNLRQRQRPWAEASKRKVRQSLEKDLYPALADRPVDRITRRDLVKILESIERRDALNIAKKCRLWLNQIFRHALALELIQTNPAADLDVLAVNPHPSVNNPFVPFSELPELMERLQEDYASNFLTLNAIRLLMLTGARPGELRQAPWEEFDLDNGLWTIPAKRMKMRRPHVVPLPRQAVEILRRVQVVTGRGQYVFPARSDFRTPMNEKTINNCLAALGYKGRQTGHGFRHLISTELNARGYNRDWIERQLAHGDPDIVRGTYNHATYLEDRRDMMQSWADELDRLLPV